MLFVSNMYKWSIGKGMAIMARDSRLGRIQACGWLAASVFAWVGGIAVADQAESGALEEITVTAQKRTENIQEVPIAITAFSAEALQQKGITSIDQLSNMSPNVNLDAGTPFSG